MAEIRNQNWDQGGEKINDQTEPQSAYKTNHSMNDKVIKINVNIGGEANSIVYKISSGEGQKIDHLIPIKFQFLLYAVMR
jgi:hypothetical protein